MPQTTVPSLNSMPTRSNLVDEPAPFGRLLPQRRGPRGRAKRLGHLAVVLPTQLRVLIDEHDVDTVTRRRSRRRQPGRPTAHHDALNGSHRLTPQSPSPRCVSTRRPSRAGVMHARTFGKPSTVTRQSWQTPMPQK